MSELCAWRSVEKRDFGADAQSGAGVACDAGEAGPAVDDDGDVGEITEGVPTLRKEKLLSRMALSEPREMRMGCRECHARAVLGGNKGDYEWWQLGA